MGGKFAEDWNGIDRSLFQVQYAYIKFGLMLEKIRNTKSYLNCSDKIADFQEFCRKKIRLPAWRANHCIEAANISIYLARQGFDILPENQAQALELRDLYNLPTGYYGDREKLDEAWAQVTTHHKPHEITAKKIAQIADPDWEEKQSLQPMRISWDRAIRLSKESGRDLDTFLNDVMDRYEEDKAIDARIDAPQTEPNPAPPEEEDILDNLDKVFKLAALCKKAATKKTDRIFESIGDVRFGTGGINFGYG